MILSFVCFVSFAVENLLTRKSTDVLGRQRRQQRSLKIPLLYFPRRGGKQRGGSAHWKLSLGAQRAPVKQFTQHSSTRRTTAAPDETPRLRCRRPSGIFPVPARRRSFSLSHSWIRASRTPDVENPSPRSADRHRSCGAARPRPDRTGIPKGNAHGCTRSADVAKA